MQFIFFVKIRMCAFQPLHTSMATMFGVCKRFKVEYKIYNLSTGRMIPCFDEILMEADIVIHIWSLLQVIMS